MAKKRTKLGRLRPQTKGSAPAKPRDTETIGQSPLGDRAPSQADDPPTVSRHRRFKRLNTSKRVDFTHEETSSFGFTRDISTDGMFLRTSNIMEEGVRLALGIHLEGRNAPLNIAGQVTRHSATEFDKGMAIQFDEADTQGRAAIAAYVLGRLESKVNERLQRRPNSVDSLQELGDIHLERGHIDEAIAAYRRVIELAPKSAEAHARLAEIDIDRARLSDNREMYAEALRHLEAADLGASNPAWRKLEDECRSALSRHQQLREEAEKRKQAEAEARKRAIQTQLEQLEQAAASNAREAERLDRERSEIADAQRDLSEQKELLKREQKKIKAEERAIEQQREQQDQLAERAQVVEKEQAKRQAELDEKLRAVEAMRGELEKELAARVQAVEQEHAKRQAELDEQLRAVEAMRGELEAKLATHMQALEAKYADEHERLTVQADAIEQARGALERHQAELEQRQSGVDRQRSTLEAQRVEQQQLLGAIARQQSELDSLRSQIERRENQLTEKRRELDEREAAFKAERQAYDGDYQRQLDELAAQKQALAEQRQQQNQRHDFLDAREQVIADQRQALADASKKSDQLQASFDEDRKRLRQLESRLEDRQKRLDEDRLCLRSREARLSEQQERLDKRSQEVSEQALQILEQSRELEARAQTIQSLAAQTEQRDKDLCGRIAQASKLEEQIHEEAKLLTSEREMLQADVDRRAAHLEVEQQAGQAELQRQREELEKSRSDLAKARQDVEDERRQLAAERVAAAREREEFEEQRVKAQAEAEARAAQLNLSLEREKAAVRSAFKNADEHRIRTERELEIRRKMLDGREESIRRAERLGRKFSDERQAHRKAQLDHHLWVTKVETLLQKLSDQSAAMAEAFEIGVHRLDGIEKQIERSRQAMVELADNARGNRHVEQSEQRFEQIRQELTSSRQVVSELRSLQSEVHSEQKSYSKGLDSLQNQLVAAQRGHRALMSAVDSISRRLRQAPPSVRSEDAALPPIMKGNHDNVTLEPAQAQRGAIEMVGPSVARPQRPYDWLSSRLGPLAHSIKARVRDHRTAFSINRGPVWSVRKIPAWVPVAITLVLASLAWAIIHPMLKKNAPEGAELTQEHPVEQKQFEGPTAVEMAMSAVPLATLEAEALPPDLESRQSVSNLALTREQIVRGAQKDSQAIKQCMDRAARRGLFKAGAPDIDLDWDVSEDGKVTYARVNPSALDSSLSACLASAMEDWRFPKASRASSVRNYPLEGLSTKQRKRTSVSSSSKRVAAPPSATKRSRAAPRAIRGSVPPPLPPPPPMRKSARPSPSSGGR